MLTCDPQARGSGRGPRCNTVQGQSHHNKRKWRAVPSGPLSEAETTLHDMTHPLSFSTTNMSSRVLDRLGATSVKKGLLRRVVLRRLLPRVVDYTRRNDTLQTLGTCTFTRV